MWVVPRTIDIANVNKWLPSWQLGKSRAYNAVIDT